MQDCSQFAANTIPHSVKALRLNTIEHTRNSYQAMVYSLASWYKSMMQLADHACVGH